MSYVSFNIVSQSPDKPGLINVRFTRKSREADGGKEKKRYSEMGQIFYSNIPPDILW